MTSTTIPKAIADRASGFDEKDVWAIFTPLAIEYGAVNLGQGFPNIPAPNFVKEAACKAISSDLNQYAPSKGLPHLRQALKRIYDGKFIDAKEEGLDADNEILVTQGANQAISLAMQAFINPGDEVILVEPYFDIYKPCVQLVGGRVVTLPMTLEWNSDGDISANEWKIDLELLKSKITPKTKAILLNNPHNPTGKLFSKAELSQLAAIIKKHDLLCFSDEVYDQLYYDNQPMIRMANMEGMWERTVTFGSGGKTFGVTGWRIGWAIGPATLLKYMLAVHARTVFTTPTPLQAAVASGLETALSNNYFVTARKDYQRRRDFALSIFRDLGLPVAIPHGSYFFMVDTSRIQFDQPPRSLPKLEDQPKDCSGKLPVGESRDYALCRWFTTQFGVTFIPPSAFYEAENGHLAANFIRVCFCKSDETLAEARNRLMKLAPYISK